jgi:hypothetical protein
MLQHLEEVGRVSLDETDDRMSLELGGNAPFIGERDFLRTLSLALTRQSLTTPTLTLRSLALSSASLDLPVRPVSAPTDSLSSASNRHPVRAS